ncbi:MAG: metal ABC transporter permease, partial [Treponema maltophilum]
ALSAVLSSLIGTYASYFLNGATGACIILTEALFFVLTMMFAPKYGMIVRRKLRKRAALPSSAAENAHAIVQKVG